MSTIAATRPLCAPARPSSAWHLAVARWLVRLRERDEMAALTAREMRDAGLTPYDVARECAMPFWRG